MVMHIPRDSELSVKRGACLDLVFDEDGHLTHTNKDHLAPRPPKRSVKAREKTHHCGKKSGKVEVQFASASPELASTRTILIGN